MRKKKRNFRVVWAGLFIACVIAAVWWLYANISGRIISLQYRDTVLETSDKIYVVSIDPKTKKGTRFELPGELILSTPGETGNWQLSSVIKMASKYPPRFLPESVGKTFKIGKIYQAGNLNFLDKFMWWVLLKQTKVTEVNLFQNGGYEEEKAPDGKIFFRLADKWDELRPDYFTSIVLANEGIGVSVYNASDYSGIGLTAEKILTSAGLRVTDVTGESVKLTECEVYGDESLAKTNTTRWITEQFDCKFNKSEAGERSLKLYLGNSFGFNYHEPGSK